jgi:hypothetical protein
MFNFFERESNDKNRLPYTRIASWLLVSSISAATMIHDVLVQQNVISKNEFEADGLLALCSEIGSFHASYILGMIMEARHVSGREHFVLTYRELEKAISEVASAFDYVSDVSQLARFWIDYQQRDQNFNYTLHYFEGEQAKLGISPGNIDLYVKEHGSANIRNLDPAQICILIRATRCMLIEKNRSLEKRSLGMEVVVQGVLKNEEVGFVGLSKAVFNLLESGAGDKPVSKLNSKKLIRDDMASFVKAR